MHSKKASRSFSLLEAFFIRQSLFSQTLSLFRLDVVLPVGSWTDSLAEEDHQNDDRQDVRRDLQVNGWQAGNAWNLVPDDTRALREAKEEGGQHSADWVVAAEDHGRQGHETLPGNSGN